MTIANDKNFWAFNLKFLFECLAFKVHVLHNKSQNFFLAGASQVIQSNLFLLGYEAFLAGQTSITLHHISRNPILLIKQVFLLHFYCTCSLKLNAGKIDTAVFQTWTKLGIKFFFRFTDNRTKCPASKKLSGQNLYLSRHCPLTSHYIELCSMYQSWYV